MIIDNELVVKVDVDKELSTESSLSKIVMLFKKRLNEIHVLYGSIITEKDKYNLSYYIKDLFVYDNNLCVKIKFFDNNNGKNLKNDIDKYKFILNLSPKYDMFLSVDTVLNKINM